MDFHMKQLHNTINDIINNVKIEDIYVSIGGKINNGRYNNSYHTLPSHLYSKETKSIILVFDVFTKCEMELNYNYLRNQNNQNTFIVLCNMYCNTPFMNEFIPYIIGLCKTISLLPTNLVICNYVKFENIPNTKEKQILNELPNSIYAMLRKTEYIECFYEWFGYNKYLSNYI